MPTSVEPGVYIIGYTVADMYEMSKYLEEVVSADLSMWSINHNQNDDAALMTEFYGRLCYKAWAPGINPNVTKIREDQQLYINNLLAQRHGSVFQHPVINFVFSNVSRVFTHELVRHRVGVAISQESMRYVRLTDIPFWEPEQLYTNIPAGDFSEFDEDSQTLLLAMENFQQKWSNKLELDESASFEYKKHMTSALRRWSPQGVATQIGWSANVDELRFVIAQRTSPAAEEEIRKVFSIVADKVKARWPITFNDLERQEDGSYKVGGGK